MLRKTDNGDDHELREPVSDGSLWLPTSLMIGSVSCTYHFCHGTCLRDRVRSCFLLRELDFVCVTSRVRTYLCRRNPIQRERVVRYPSLYLSFGAGQKSHAYTERSWAVIPDAYGKVAHPAHHHSRRRPVIRARRFPSPQWYDIVLNRQRPYWTVTVICFITTSLPLRTRVGAGHLAELVLADGVIIDVEHRPDLRGRGERLVELHREVARQSPRGSGRPRGPGPACRSRPSGWRPIRACR